MRRALATFPDASMAQRALDKYFIVGGKAADKPFRSLPMWSINPSQHLMEIAVLANYCEVWLAKHNEDGSPIRTEHGDGLVGVNRLTKVQLPTLYSLYGAMLAEVDYVIMGAGIPLQIPGALDAMAAGKDTTFPVDVEKSDARFETTFSPADFWKKAGKPDMAQKLLKRPAFIPIVSSVVLAQSLLKRATGQGPTKGIDGFVIELPTAGGHNAPPRGFRYDPAAKTHAMDLNEKGEPIYGPKDEVDLAKFKKVVKDLPFWLAGSFAHAEKVKEILELGGSGVQVGTMFALSKESGMSPKTREQILDAIAQGKVDMDVFTDPAASPTGYPFKVLDLPGTLSDATVYDKRPRQCSLGYLRQPYIDEATGKLGYKCAAEPVKDYVAKGGEVDGTVGRKCLCNALMANVDLGQTRIVKTDDGNRMYTEDQLITIGDEVNECQRFLRQDGDGHWSFTAKDVVHYLKSQVSVEDDSKATLFDHGTWLP
mmetsp:Transcript_15650/g.43155  ORF Transcript_15650/g.43155 Transcript_15650/m.43155 type:complete len:482 (+) Transcript_15650:578-2023(+)